MMFEKQIEKDKPSALISTTVAMLPSAVESLETNAKFQINNMKSKKICLLLFLFLDIYFWVVYSEDGDEEVTGEE
ncbi:hypothetical protein Lalb_Chr03g0032341 [Lupinus albus]|uniref:Uncharacterized protein n=1 Tax=Lupinus albus TaxID=3870 RepID=A0A6A4QS61_LUPAL|nr:hypothetical protein Lalb_Chr03g0032341 [Lupinus albus]